MPGSVFKVVVDGGDWGSPLSNRAEFDNLEDALAEARLYLQRQNASGGPGGMLHATIEEVAPDGSKIVHAVGPD